jgi:peroxiredoxin Q/BCP
MGLKVGDQLPEFDLLDQNGERFSSEQLKGNAFVLYFYPKDDTPGCTAEACSFRDSYEEFEEMGAKVVGVSADSPEKHKQFAEKHRLPFTLLSDKGNQLRKAFGVPKSFFGLLPGRVTYIFDENAKLLHSFNSQLKVNQHIKEALTYLKEQK